MNALNRASLPIDDAVYAMQLDGEGGAHPVQEGISEGLPVWIHLDYSHPVSAAWLENTPLIPELLRPLLAGESQRPRASKVGEGVLLTLRNINYAQEERPEQLITLCIYLTKEMIISTQYHHAYGLTELLDSWREKCGPMTSAGWVVQLTDAITDHLSEFIDDLHDRIIQLEEDLLEQKIPGRGAMALLRKQLIVLRRYISPQRDVLLRLATESHTWMSDLDRQHIRDISERLGRGLDDVDACIARTTILADEITSLMTDSLNRRSYIMSLLAMLFLPMTFLTGLLGVNLGGIPGNESPYGFAVFSLLLLLTLAAVAWWLKRRKWL